MEVLIPKSSINGRFSSQPWSWSAQDIRLELRGKAVVLMGVFAALCVRRWPASSIWMYILDMHIIYIYIFKIIHLLIRALLFTAYASNVYVYIYIDILPKFEFISNFHVVHMRSIEISHPRRRGKNTMIRKALANGHEEHPEVDFSKMALEWGFV